MNNVLHSYYAALTADLASVYTAEDFACNQVLTLAPERDTCMMPQQITYYLPELDKMETIPVAMLQFCGSEVIDSEHYFFFFKIDPDRAYNKLKAAQRVLCATIALVPMQGFTRLMVQHVEAISESTFTKDHLPLLNQYSAIAC